MEKSVARKVGKMMSVGFTLPIATRTATREEGNSCKEVAFKTKNIAEAYSEFSVLFNNCAACTPYGVAAPEIPKTFTDKFIQTAERAASSSVLSKRLAAGFKILETPRVTPLSSHSFINPIQTA